MKLRPDLLDAKSPRGAEVVQLTTEPEERGSHIYQIRDDLQVNQW